MNIRKKILAKLKNISTKKFNEDSLIKQIGIDSLDLAELVVEVEVAYNVKISDEELIKMEKIKDVLNIIENKIKNIEI